MEKKRVTVRFGEAVRNEILSYFVSLDDEIVDLINSNTGEEKFGLRRTRLTEHSFFCTSDVMGISILVKTSFCETS